MQSGGPIGDESMEPSCPGERRKRTEQRDRSISKQQELNAFLGSLRMLWRQSKPAKRRG